jgi:hypothetical protein
MILEAYNLIVATAAVWNSQCKGHGYSPTRTHTWNYGYVKSNGAASKTWYRWKLLGRNQQSKVDWRIVQFCLSVSLNFRPCLLKNVCHWVSAQHIRASSTLKFCCSSTNCLSAGCDSAVFFFLGTLTHLEQNVPSLHFILQRFFHYSIIPCIQFKYMRT